MSKGAKMKFEFICDDGVFYTPLNKFLEFIMGETSYQIRADFANRFQNIQIRTFENIGVNGRLYIRVDDLINQTLKSYEMSEYERFNEFMDFCKKNIFSIKIIEKTDQKAEIENLKTEITHIKRALEVFSFENSTIKEALKTLGVEYANGVFIVKEQPKKKLLGLF